MKKSRSLRFGFLLRATPMFALLLAGCATHQTVSRVVPYSAARLHLEAGLTQEDKTRVDRNCPFGEPKLSPAWNFGPTDLVAKDGYVLIHSAADKIPLWVCEHVTAAQLEGKAGRDNKFFPEPSLKPGRRAELSDYNRSGFDRGHQAPAADFKADQQLMDQTFSLANMAPQWPNLNRKMWAHLEDKVRAWIGERGEGYIITGPLFWDPKEDVAETANGLVDHEVIGKGVSVPTHFYKIVVAQSDSGQWQSIAFVVPNLKKTQPENFPAYLVSISWIEKHTGVNFMPNLDAAEEQRLEQTTSVLWP